jgi:hypothetical protein
VNHSQDGHLFAGSVRSEGRECVGAQPGAVSATRRWNRREVVRQITELLLWKILRGGWLAICLQRTHIILDLIIRFRF